MKLNESEHIALNWLKTKYQPKDIIRKSNCSPDFLCCDESYEVKKLYNNTLVFNETQIEVMEKMNPIIIVVDKGKIVSKFNWSERKKFPYKIHIAKINKSGTTIWISQDNKARLEALGKFGENYDDVLGKILDVFELKKATELIKNKAEEENV